MCSKIFKILMCFTLIFTMSMALKPKEKAHAVLPLLAPIAGAVVGEVASELGWKYVGKPAFKAVKDKIAGQVQKNTDKFDFTKKKPKKKGSKIDIDVSPLDRAKIASMLKEEGSNVIELDKKRSQKMTNPSYEVDFNVDDPFYSTGVHLNLVSVSDSAESLQRKDFVSRMFNVEFVPNAFDGTSDVNFISVLTGDVYAVEGVVGGNPYVEYNYMLSYYTSTDLALFRINDGEYLASEYIKNFEDSKEWKMYESYIEQLQQNNRTIYMAGGLIVPEDNTRIYNVPLDTPSSYVLPNSTDLDVDISIPIAGGDDTEIDLEWEDLVQYENDINNYENTVIERGDVTITNDYSTYIVNNYYTADDGEPTIEEVENEIENEIIIIGDGSGGSGGAGDLTPVDDPIEVPEGFFHELYEVGQYIGDMYNGITSYLVMAVDGMEELASGASGLVEFLGEFFDWLPDEYVAILSSGFMLGVVAFFVRR